MVDSIDSSLYENDDYFNEYSMESLTNEDDDEANNEANENDNEVNENDILYSIPMTDDCSTTDEMYLRFYKEEKNFSKGCRTLLDNVETIIKSECHKEQCYINVANSLRNIFNSHDLMLQITLEINHNLKDRMLLYKEELKKMKNFKQI
jgi:hypothetical protein